MIRHDLVTRRLPLEGVPEQGAVPLAATFTAFVDLLHE